MVLRIGLMVFTLLSSFSSFAQERIAEEIATVDATPPAHVIDPAVREQATKRWQKEIEALEALDQTENHTADEILMIGSSSVRLWKDVSVDMAPYRVIRRGYGGARYSDLAVFAERLIHPHAYRAMVVFVANDITGDPNDPSVDQVEQWVRHIVEVSQRHQPDAPVMIIEVTPTEKRFDHWPKIRRLNARLREIALATPKVFFTSTADHYLDSSGNPMPEFFVEDKLHLNAQGYDVWAELIRAHLDHVLRLMASESTEPTSP